MFLFSDPTLLEAVINARRRGVKVRIMLNPARRSGEAENVATRKALEKAGVDVADSNPAFELTHEKSMIVDDGVAFVKSLNWETRNLTETRDYAVVTRVPDDKLIEGVGGLRILHDVGVKVHKPKGLRLHAKMLLADGERAIVGSINLAPGSFDGRRELAIEMDDPAVVKRLHDVAQKDWRASRKLDLSDEGLLADLAKRGNGGAEKLLLGDI